MIDFPEIRYLVPMILGRRSSQILVAALVALRSLVAGVDVAHADIQLGAYSLRAAARARVDPNTNEKIDMVENGHAGALQAIFVQATASDSAVISELVDTTGSVEVTTPNSFTVLLSALRSGTDDTLDVPGGTYSAKTTFELAFVALAGGTITVGENFSFQRPNTGTFTPYGITLESGADQDSRGPTVPFNAKSGSGGNPEQFTLLAGHSYVLRIEIAMVGGTSNTAEEESWGGGFSVQLPPLAPATTSTTTTTILSSSSTTITPGSSTTATTITGTSSTTTTTLVRLCPFVPPAVCASSHLPRSITRKLKQGCTLADRIGTVSPSRAGKLRKRSEAKLLAACRATTKVAGKPKVSTECAGSVLGMLGARCGG